MTNKQVMMQCEARLSIEERQGNATPSGKIEATVTTWGPREGQDGRRFYYTPEGFADWAKEFTTTGRPLPMFVNHNADDIPVGEWTSFEFTEDGMTASGRLYMNTTKGADLYQVMSESPAMFGGVSVGAYAENYQWVKEDGEIFPAGSDDYYDEGFFQITKGGLSEVSVVMYPNNDQAQVSKLEFFREDGSADLKVLEQALRDAGLLKKDAVTSVSILKKALEKRDATSESIENSDAKRDSDADVTHLEILAALEQRELLKQLDKRLKG
jgi:HK97 family phage prohead protease